MMRRDRRGERGVAVWMQLPLQNRAEASTFDDLWKRIIGEKFECTCEWCDPVNGKRPNKTARYWDGTCRYIRMTPDGCNGTNDANKAVRCPEPDAGGAMTPLEVVTA
jgi:hypothetical protein